MGPDVKELIGKLSGIFLVFIALSLLLSFVSFVDLSNTGLSGFIDKGETYPEEKAPTSPIKKIPFSYEEANIENLSQISDPPQIPIFFVEGLNKNTNHLRLYTSSNYKNGWIKDSVEYGDSMVSFGGRITRFSVTPIISFTKHVPVAKDTFMVTAEVQYNTDTGTYLVEDGNVSSKYTGFSSSSSAPSDNVLIETNADKILSESMDNIDIEYLEDIRELSLQVTKNAKNDFQKAKMIEQYLYNNYEYSTDPWFYNSDNPIHTFLFVEKKGICKHFASAFITMCRSINLPARGVFGYLAKPVGYNQTVFANQAHMWAEVKFEDGWIEFDPTPPLKKADTKTEITYIDESANSGRNFTVKGEVSADIREAPEGYVEIYLKKDKREEGTLVDVLSLKDGKFSGNITAPNISGQYHVIGHYVGSLTFYESWSDPIIKIYSPPSIKSDLPEKTGTKSIIRGTIYDFNGTEIHDAEIILKIDGKTRDVTTAKNGTFEFPVAFNQLGSHEVELYYPGHEFILPVSEKKIIEVGKIELSLNNRSLIRGGNWNSSGSLLFNGEPLDTLIEFRELQFAAYSKNGNIEFNVDIPENVPLGRIPIKYFLPELNYESSIILSIKARTMIDVSVKKDSGYTVLVHLTDDKNNPISGQLDIYDQTVMAENGFARIEINNLPEKFSVEFQGSDKYLPSSKEVDLGGFPYWLLTLPVLFAALLSYRLRNQRYIFFEIVDDTGSAHINLMSDMDKQDKNHALKALRSNEVNSGKYQMLESLRRWFINREKEKFGNAHSTFPVPPVWEIDEDVKIRVINKGKGVVRVLLDGEGIGVDKSLELKLKFNEHGNHILLAERIEDSKIKERAKMEIKIMNYRDAVVEVFEDFVQNLEKESEINLKDQTAREIVKKAGISGFKSIDRNLEGASPEISVDKKRLISISETARYGYSYLTREDFLTAYNICSRIKGEF